MLLGYDEGVNILCLRHIPPFLRSDEQTTAERRNSRLGRFVWLFCPPPLMSSLLSNVDVMTLSENSCLHVGGDVDWKWVKAWLQMRGENVLMPSGDSEKMSLSVCGSPPYSGLQRRKTYRFLKAVFTPHFRFYFREKYSSCSCVRDFAWMPKRYNESYILYNLSIIPFIPVQFIDK